MVWTVISSFTFIAVKHAEEMLCYCEARTMGQLNSRRSLLYFLLFFAGCHDLRGRNMISQARLQGHRNVVKMPPGVRGGAVSSEALFLACGLCSVIEGRGSITCSC